jgi:hypothetical protein
MKELHWAGQKADLLAALMAVQMASKKVARTAASKVG